MHSFILQIPPHPSSTTMRSSFYLRLTLDVFDRAITYPVRPAGAHSSETLDPDELALLEDLLKFFIVMDEGWYAILTFRSWNSSEDTPIVDGTPSNSNSFMGSRSVDTTTRTVLHSAILSGTTEVDNWLYDDLGLQRAEIREKFGEAFWKTLEVLEGVEEGTEAFTPLPTVDEVELPNISGIDLDDDADPGMFHGFDDL
ncbi:hypothetical protein DL93DRAFT_2075010 [Clavulina sp. PMI_390]|nr:hypothetical protein DL93DRAFT_2075010 [Clavulina sp. PMI_390]